MSTTSPILLLSRSPRTRPSQPWAVSMLGVAMLASFLVGTSVGRYWPHHAAGDQWVACCFLPPRTSTGTATACAPGWPRLGGARPGPARVLVERRGGMLYQFAGEPALIMFRSARPAVPLTWADRTRW